MLGHKAREFKQHESVSLEDLVPEDNFYRQVECCLDFCFIRDLVCELDSEIGWPSIDSVVFFKLQLIAYRILIPGRQAPPYYLPGSG